MRKAIIVLVLGGGTIGLVWFWFAILSGKIETSYILVALVWTLCLIKAVITTMIVVRKER